MMFVFDSIGRILKVRRFHASSVSAGVMNVAVRFSVSPNIGDTVSACVSPKNESCVAFAVLKSRMDETAIVKTLTVRIESLSLVRRLRWDGSVV